MTQQEKFIYHTTAYTVGISIAFFLFAKILRIDELSISFLRYFTIFAFSMVLSGSEFIFTLNRMPVYLKHLIHYLITCVAFFFVFLTVQNSSGEYQFRIHTVFAAVVIFSAIYSILTLIYLFVFKCKLTKNVKKEENKFSNKTTKYKPRFK